MCSLLDWLNKYEAAAVWIEGLALVAIFGLDWWNGRKGHEETLAQLKVSQKQVEASQEQAEAMQKPCLMLSATSRPGEDAILNMGGAVGGMMLLCPGGDVQLENVGSGPAVNVRYNLTPTDPASTIVRPNGYLVGMLPGEKFLTPIAREILRHNEWEVVFTYESLSGGKYRTKSIVNDLVLTDIKFGRVVEQ
jgi:hypothetical protein